VAIQLELLDEVEVAGNKDLAEYLKLMISAAIK